MCIVYRFLIELSYLFTTMDGFHVVILVLFCSLRTPPLDYAAPMCIDTELMSYLLLAMDGFHVVILVLLPTSDSKPHVGAVLNLKMITDKRKSVEDFQIYSNVVNIFLV